MNITKYDPTGRVRNSQPELTNEEIDALIKPTSTHLITKHPVMFIDQYLSRSAKPKEIAGFINHEGELHEYDSPITRLPLAVISLGPEKVYFYQHGLVGFTHNQDGEHNSEIWNDEAI